MQFGGGVLSNTSKKKRLAIGILVVGLVTSIGMSSLNYFCNYESPIEKENDKQIVMYVEGNSGEYEVSNSNTFPAEGYVLNLEKSNCKNGGILSQDPTTKALSLLTSSQDSCTVYFDKEKTPAEKTLETLNVTSNGVRTDFDDPATTDEGIFEMEDDYGTSYYYRGAVTNNYVKFAGFYWRIIRVNGDGSLRIIYDGTGAHANGELSLDEFIKTNQIYNANWNDAKYVGWMYGPVGALSTSKEEAQANIESSDIKKVVDEWYKTNIVDKGYGGAVADVLFCNDRSTPGKTNTGWNDDTGLGYGAKYTAYGATSRTGVWNLSTTPMSPTFKCPQKNDAFTVNDKTKGNGALDYSVGLITADEIVAAGSTYNGTNRSYYLYRSNYWTLSPFYVYAPGAAVVFYVSGNNQLYGGGVSNPEAVAPVINLSAEYANTLIGAGTMTDPFRASDVTP